ncbi:MAG: 16S rRNA (guanine(527)-N(7))-methyltransferase RsmG [Alphaproteobacteria bacterium]|jgi:16S rRNA (guanine527-N7)-methyltransferase|nr:16S rRNA (guanine(527)-N(7))-methyltransferase RsmG [Alphaproteobacteria bacterium]MDP6590593.1 16S rRNA (guanine(527)-N(7))-methyltransferase RsmG [Alphaproteobacteria bacterium]MDP6819714.1 16S rRNA (guanine(527)-N(7))-methyltransferase RsmG [Alphaproteobacteria bacterium]
MARYGVENFMRDSDVSRETCERLALYVELLERWNRRVNLVSKRSLSDIWRRHMADSAQLRDVIPRYDGALVDVGSGAGLPGLVLAIMGLSNIHLVESSARKCAFLREARRITGCAAEVHNFRLGDDASAIDTLPKAAVVTARAVSPLANLLDIVYPIVYDRTCCIFPKGARVDDEVETARLRWNFELRRVPSKLDPSGVILKIHNIRRREI